MRWRPTAACAPATIAARRCEEKERERPGFYSADASAAQPLLHPLGGGAGGEDRARAEPGGQAPGVRAQGAADGGEHRGATRLKTARRSTIWRGSGGPTDAHRADRLDLPEPAGADAVPRPRCAADGAAGVDLHRRRRLGAGDQRRRSTPSPRRIPGCAVRHVWHEDRGFEKAAILNRAIATSEAEFLMFLDGDVLIHPDFLARHLELARPGRFSHREPDPARRGGERAGDAGDDRAGTVVFDRGWLRAQPARSTVSAPGSRPCRSRSR